MAQSAVYKKVWTIRLLSISARVLAAFFAGLLLVGPGLHAQQGVSEKEVLGVLQRCVQCHGPALQMSKLDLSTREGMLKGGDHGVALVPGNASGPRSGVDERRNRRGQRLDQRRRSHVEWPNGRNQ